MLRPITIYTAGHVLRPAGRYFVRRDVILSDGTRFASGRMLFCPAGRFSPPAGAGGAKQPLLGDSTTEADHNLWWIGGLQHPYIVASGPKLVERG